MTFLQDLRTAARTLAHSSAITALATVCLTAGIAAATTIFSLTDTFWLRALPVDDPRSVVEVHALVHGEAGRVSYPDYEDFQRLSHTLAGLAASARFGPVLQSPGGPGEPAVTTVATSNYFTVLGVKALHGRVFTDNDSPSADPVVVISYSAWHRRFGGQESILGRHVTLGGRSYAVIGVVGPEFLGTDPSIAIDVWVPFDAWFVSADSRRSLADRGERAWDVVGRLQPGVPIDRARADVAAVATSLARAYPATNLAVAATVAPAAGDPGYQPYLLLGLVTLALLIACANVANLLLARAEARRREFAIRQALGASRWRLARQILSEGLVLAAVSAVAALVIAAWTIRALPAVVVPPSTHAVAWKFVLDVRAVAFTAAAALFSALACSAIPAFTGWRGTIAAVVGSDRTSGTALRAPIRKLLVMAQVTLAVVTITCAALLLRAFVAGSALDLGFDRKDMLLAQVYTPHQPAEARAFFEQLLGRLRANPRVRSATTALRPPMWPSEGGRSILVAVPGWTGPAGETAVQIKEGVVGVDYFRTLGTPVIQGRGFHAEDDEAARRVAMINATMARRFWPNESAVGKVIRVGSAAQDREIVGVVRDARINSVEETPEPYLYLPFAQTNLTYQNVMVEVRDGRAAEIAPLLRAEIARLDRRVMIYQVWTMRELLRSQFFDREMPAIVATAVGLLALVLAIAGLYGVVAYTVFRRTREIGIRMALGANRAAMLGLMLRHGLGLALAGVACGLVAATALSPLLAHWLHGVSPRDPLTLAAVATLMTIVALVASYFPARRATRVDPMVALRCE